MYGLILDYDKHKIEENDKYQITKILNRYGFVRVYKGLYKIEEENALAKIYKSIKEIKEIGCFNDDNLYSIKAFRIKDFSDMTNFFIKEL